MLVAQRSSIFFIFVRDPCLDVCSANQALFRLWRMSHPHQREIIRTLSNQGSYFSLQGIASVFKSPADKRIARSFYTRSYGLFSFIWLYTKPDYFCLSWWLSIAKTLTVNYSYDIINPLINKNLTRRKFP